MTELRWLRWRPIRAISPGAVALYGVSAGEQEMDPRKEYVVSRFWCEAESIGPLLREYVLPRCGIVLRMMQVSLEAART